MHLEAPAVEIQGARVDERCIRQEEVNCVWVYGSSRRVCSVDQLDLREVIHAGSEIVDGVLVHWGP